jgi:hypothetical protein
MLTTVWKAAVLVVLLIVAYELIQAVYLLDFLDHFVVHVVRASNT